MSNYYTSPFTAVAQLAAVTVGMPTAGYSSLLTGTLQSAAAGEVPELGPASVTLASAASAANSAYNGCAIRITAGTGAGARGTITSYVGSTRVAKVEWGTGVTGSAGVPATLDNTSVYEISIDCDGRQKILVKVEYGNSTCTAGLRVCLRDANGKVIAAAKQTPVNLGITDQATSVGGNLAEGFEVATDGMDTAYLIVDTAPSGGTSPSVSAWAVGV